MFFLAAFVGNFLGTAFLSWVIETFSFKQKNPTGRAAWTVGIVTALGLAITFFTRELDAAAMISVVIQLVAATLVFIWFRHRYEKKWSDGPQDVFE